MRLNQHDDDNLNTGVMEVGVKESSQVSSMSGAVE